MKRNTKRFFRSFTVSFIIMLCPVLTFLGICRAFEGTKLISTGEKCSAIEPIYGADDTLKGLKILDFELIIY